MTVSLISTGVQFPDSSVQTTAAGAFGISQTWQNMTASRASATTYTNSSGKPIAIIIHHTNSAITPTVDGTALGTDQGGNNNTNTILTFLVPSGSTYSVSYGSIVKWMEMR